MIKDFPINVLCVKDAAFNLVEIYSRKNSTVVCRGNVCTRGNKSGSIQMMLRLGLSVFSRATSFKISKNSKPSRQN